MMRPVERHPSSTGRRALLWGVPILLVAAFLRLAAFEQALVGSDQSVLLAQAADIAAFRSLPPVGIKSSVGVMQTAAVSYLAAPVLWLVPRVIAVKWWFSVLDVLAVAALHRAVRGVWGGRAAHVTAFLYATSPWVVEFVRWIWYQSLLPTFATFALACLLRLLSPRRTRRCEDVCLALGLWSAAWMGAVHLAGAGWGVIVAVSLSALGLRRRRWRGLTVGWLLELLTTAPYLLYLARTRLADLRLLAGETRGWNVAAFRLAAELISGRGVLATPRDALWAERVVHPAWLWDVPPGLVVAGAMVALRLAVSRRALRRPTWLVLAWTVGVPLLFLPTSVHLQHFYLLPLFPAPYVLAGVSGGSGGEGARRWRWWGRVGCLIALGVGGWWAYLWGVRVALEHQGQLRAPTRAWLMDATVAQVSRYIQASPEAQVIVLTAYDPVGSSPFDWMRNWLGTDRLRVVPSGRGLIVPPAEACYLVGPGASAAQLAPLEGRAARRPAMRIPATPPWEFYCAPAPPPPPPPLATWENGVRLVGVDVGPVQAGGLWRITYRWHCRQLREGEFHIFNHLLQGETLVAQRDGMGVPSWYWREGDVLITTFELPLPDALPPGTYRLLTGFYTWPALERVFLTDGSPAYEVTRRTVR